jgi:hypothetical protein
MSRFRRNLCHDYIRSSRGQHDFVMLVSGNHQFRAYYKERNKKEKARIDGILNRCNDRNRWRCMDVLTSSLSCHFKLVHKLCSNADYPLSAYPLLVQGLKNDINKGMTDEFDAVLGDGAREEVWNMLSVRFNMDGFDPSGRKVGLLDRHHLMAFICDPCGHELRATFQIQTPLAALMREMIDLYVPLDADGSSASRSRVMKEFMASVSL